MKLQDVRGGVKYAVPPGRGSIEIKNQADFDAHKKACREQAGNYLFVSVWNCCASLALAELRENGSMSMYAVDDYEDDSLADSVEEAGGFVNLSGWYPLSGAAVVKIKEKRKNWK